METAKASASSRRLGKTSVLAPLTTFRFFAALAIVFVHILQNDQYSYLTSGVSLFFVLSGFVLTYVHPRLEGIAAYTRFWVARIGRIWPLHILTLIYVLIVQPFGRTPYKHFFSELLFNVLLLQCWVPVRRVAMSFNFVSWSLSVEFFFYLMFPFLLPYVFKAPGRMMLASVGLYFVVVIAAIFAGLPDSASVNTVTFPSFLFCPILHLYEFVLGMTVAVWWLSSREKTKEPVTWSSIEALVFISTLLFIPALHTMVRLLLGGNTRYAIDLQLENLLHAPLFALLIYVFAFQAGFCSRIFSHPWLVYLGDISFSTYMIHCILLVAFSRLDESLIPPMKWTLFGVSLLAASGLLHAFWEKPARGFLVETVTKALHI